MSLEPSDETSAEQYALIGVSEAAEILRVSKQMVYLYLDRDDFPRPVKVKGRRKWVAADLAAWRAGHPRYGSPDARPVRRPARKENAILVGYAHLLAYTREHGHALVPMSYAAPDGYRLGVWVASQRVAYRRGRLPTAAVEILDATPEWEWSPPMGRAATVARERRRGR